MVLDVGHTPGQHAQSLNTPTTQIQNSTFFFYDGCWFPSCNVVLSRRAKAMISLLSLCYHGCWRQLCDQWQLLIALLACAMFVDVLTGSHSSAGQSVRLITVRSAVHARVGPVFACCCCPRTSPDGCVHMHPAIRSQWSAPTAALALCRARSWATSAE